MKTSVYIKKICLIIFLTNILALLSMPVGYAKGLAWILGSVASVINFLWMAKVAKDSLDITANGAKLRSIKGFYLRFLTIVIYSTLIVIFVKPDIIVFGLGLLAAQVAIYIEYFSRNLLNSKWIKYLRGTYEKKEK